MRLCPHTKHKAPADLLRATLLPIKHNLCAWSPTCCDPKVLRGTSLPIDLLPAPHEGCRVSGLGVPLVARHTSMLVSGMSLHEYQDHDRQQGELDRDHGCCKERCAKYVSYTCKIMLGDPGNPLNGMRVRVIRPAWLRMQASIDAYYSDPTLYIELVCYVSSVLPTAHPTGLPCEA